MKIKAVCEATGLTDRAIRYYIEESILSPAYSENYLGRKTYIFSEDDIRALKDIATLRKFGFSVLEIRQMLETPDRIIPIVKDLQQRKESTIGQEQQLLNTLYRLDEGHSYTVPELAAQLCAPVADSPLPSEDSKTNFRNLIKGFFRGLFYATVTWLPIVIAVFLGAYRLHMVAIPSFNYRNLLIALLALSPSFLMLSTTEEGLRFFEITVSRKVLVILCVISIPISSFLPVLP